MKLFKLYFDTVTQTAVIKTNLVILLNISIFVSKDSNIACVYPGKISLNYFSNKNTNFIFTMISYRSLNESFLSTITFLPEYEDPYHKR